MQTDIADVIIEAMPFSDEIIEWCKIHPEFKEALKVTNPDRFYALGMIITSHPRTAPEDLVIGFFAYDMVKDIFKQDFIVDIGNKHTQFMLYSNVQNKQFGKHVQHINQFYAKYGKNGDYANTHHVTLDYIVKMGNDELSERAIRTVATSKKIMAAGGRRPVSQKELAETLEKIRAAKKAQNHIINQPLQS